MIKEWATVVSWSQGEALVECDVKTSCKSCSSRSGCGTRVLNKLGPQMVHTIAVSCDKPLVKGQKVELGIGEGSLLRSALLVYMSPLVGLFLMAALFQTLFAQDFATLCGAILGGVGGFLLARHASQKLAMRNDWQPVIISVGLPPDMVRIEDPSADNRQ
jgi:sigma-E factor negative regulatory protein RseC